MTSSIVPQTPGEPGRLDDPRRAEAPEAALREYGSAAAGLNWIVPERAREAERERREILAAIGERALVGCGGAKLDCKNLSPGCQVCARAEWSCLFISGLCNAACFFCPTSQDEQGTPMTAGIEFPDAGDYADYLRVFGFTGASISGGEPLLNPRDCVRFLKTIRARLGDGVHLWLYTNGKLVTRDALAALRDAGLDEIRFNIAATGLNLDAARRAVGTIPTVTIEIPAVPEMEPALRRSIVAMYEAGIDHLNLHQLRLTRHNLPHLAGRPYTFLPGASGTVLESELTALRLLLWTLDEEIGLPVNYCSFAYRHRNFGYAARARGIPFARKNYEDSTATGYLRQVTVEAAPEALAAWIEALEREGHPGERWSLVRQGSRLEIPAGLLSLGTFVPDFVSVTYHQCQVLPAMTYKRMFVEVPLNANRSLFVERAPACGPIVLDADQAKALGRFARGEESAAGELPAAIRPYEVPETGLSPYE